MAVSPCDIPQIGVFCGVAKTVGSSVGGSVLSDIAKAAVDGEVELLKILTTAYLHVPTPALSSSQNAVDFLQGSLNWIVAAVAVMSLIVAGGRLALARKADSGREAFQGLLRLIIVTGVGVAGISLLTDAGNAFSNSILSESTKDPAAQITTLATLTTTAIASPFLLMILAAFAIVGMLLQIGLLLARSAILVVLAGILPLSAASSMMPSGSAWFKKTVGWILAWVLLKPATAIIFAAAFKLMVSSPNAIGSIEGIVLLLMALLALPVLLKLVVPAVAAVGGIGTAAAVGAAAGVGVGAAMIVGSGGAAAVAGGAGKFAPGLLAKGAGPASQAPAGASNAKTAMASAGQAHTAGKSVKGAIDTVTKTAEKAADGASNQD